MSPALDYVVVGAGMFGSVFARCAADAGRRVLLVDRRPHIAGNCYSEAVDGIEVHRYGPHIFHTRDAGVWAFVNRFTEFNHYRHRGLVRNGERLLSFPINLATLHQVWGVTTPEEATARLEAAREPADGDNLESWIVSQVGRELYELFIRGYTAKQWGRDPRDLPASIIKRIPIRLTWDDNYFDDAYQGIPAGGYTRMFQNMLDHENIRVETEVDFFEHRRELEQAAPSLVYSGKIDEFFDYRFGELDYRSLRFQTEQKAGDFQGASIVNYTSADVPYTRIVEHKHFALQQSDRTVITYEFPQKYERGREPFYPIRDWRNTNVYERYRQLAQTGRAIFGGRLGSYQYFDMHQVVGQAIATAKRELGEGRQSIARAA
jgi:UDP-galactopyranose mutase